MPKANKAAWTVENEWTRVEREGAAAPGAAATRGEDNALSVKVTDETEAQTNEKNPVDIMETWFEIA